MISGTHMIIYSKDADADRAFFRDVLEFSSVDAGHGWLIFALPPAEIAFHPYSVNDLHEIYLMTDNLDDTTSALRSKNIICSEIHEESWGRSIRITLPGGGKLGLYQPKHPTANGVMSR